MSAKLTAAQIKALKAVGLDDAQIAALSGQKPAPTEQYVHLSCWTASSKPGVKSGTKFQHTDAKGRKKSYVRLSEAEAVRIMKANLAAGRFYAMPA